MLVAFHEFFESMACAQAGISQHDVDQFDMDFERDRKTRMEEAARHVTEPGVTSAEEALIKIEEPGDNPNAPYSMEHCMATGVERIFAAALGVSWSEYEKEIDSLP